MDEAVAFGIVVTIRAHVLRLTIDAGPVRGCYARVVRLESRVACIAVKLL